MKEVKDS